MNLDALSSSQHLAHMLTLSGHTPAALEPLLKQAIGQNASLCAMFNTKELGQQFSDFSNEPHCLAIAVPDSGILDWTAQLADWIIPYCEVNHKDRTTRALLMLGEGPIAVPTFALAPMLFGVESVLVVFSTREGTLVAAYRWNEKFLATVEAADIAAKNYEFDDYASACAVAIGKPIFGCSEAPASVPLHVSLEADGMFQLYEEPNVQLLPFSPYDPEYVD
jgi:hypothetical protein